MEKLSDDVTEVAFQVLPNESHHPAFEWTVRRVFDADARLKDLGNLLVDAAENWDVTPIFRFKKGEKPEGPNFEQVPDRLGQIARWSVTTASEAIHHLRAALDYLVHHAVWLNTGSRNDATQFPLSKTEADWKRTVKTQRVRGLRSDQLEWIREVQPYTGVEWSRELMYLSNHDKHRVAIQILPAYEMRFDPNVMVADPLGDDDYASWQLTETILHLRLTDAYRDIEDTDALEVVRSILTGVIDITNKFLVDVGMNPIEMTEGK